MLELNPHIPDSILKKLRSNHTMHEQGRISKYLIPSSIKQEAYASMPPAKESITVDHVNLDQTIILKLLRMWKVHTVYRRHTISNSNDFVERTTNIDGVPFETEAKSTVSVSIYMRQMICSCSTCAPRDKGSNPYVL